MTRNHSVKDMPALLVAMAAVVMLLVLCGLLLAQNILQGELETERPGWQSWKSADGSAGTRRGTGSRT